MQINKPTTIQLKKYNITHTKFISPEQITFQSMNPKSDRKSSHSLDSSRISNMSNSVPVNDQVKRMQAKLLMDYYRKNEQIRQKKSMQENFDKYNYGHFEKSLTQNYLQQQQVKRNRKDEIKQNLASQYDQMIKLKQQRARQQRQRQRELQKKNFQIFKWGRDNKQDFIKQKKMKQQYGKQLEMHLRLQEIIKYEQKVKQKQMIEKFQKQQQEKNRNYDQNQINNFKRKQMFERRQNQILGISQPRSNNPQVVDTFKSIQLGDHNKRALKKRQQMLYGSGLQQQLRSHTISPQPYDKPAYQSQSSIKTQRRVPDYSFNASEVYNPITNPIQINYKNPYVLRMLAQHNN